VIDWSTSVVGAASGAVAGAGAAGW